MTDKLTDDKLADRLEAHAQRYERSAFMAENRAKRRESRAQAQNEKGQARLFRSRAADLRSAIAEIHRLRGERDEAVETVRQIEKRTAPHPDDAPADTAKDALKANAIARAFLAKLEERG